MDYYEEFGVSRTASTDEIRQAYKTLARMFHPDQQPDGKLRVLADLQMKRLNAMLATLTDAEARDRYNRGLDGNQRLPEVAGPAAAASVFAWPVWRKPVVWVWGLAAVIGIAGMVWFWGQAQTGSPAASALSVPPAIARPDAPPPRAASSREAELRSELARARQEIENLRTAPVRTRLPRSEPEAIPPAATPPVATPVAPVVAATVSEVTAAAPDKPAPTLGGEWFYVKSLHGARPAGLYPPEYIELKVVVESGMLRANYRARYQVSDRAISPDVVFEFAGLATMPAAHFVWSDAGGARGQVTLALHSADTLEVSWHAERFSDEIGLASGTATLVRRQVR